MSEAVSTSPASPPSACPTWEPKTVPPILPSMPISGPAMARASAGIEPPIAPFMALVTWAATGSTSTFQTSIVCSIHSARLHAAPTVTPDASGVTVSSQWSASRTESATRSRSVRLGVGSGFSAAERRAMSLARVQFTAPSYGVIRCCIWPSSALRSGIGPPAPPRAPNICSNGVPLNGF